MPRRSTPGDQLPLPLDGKRVRARRRVRDTSRIANARRDEAETAQLKREIVSALRHHPMTAEELQAHIDVDRSVDIRRLMVIRRRISDLRNAGAIIDSGERRINECNRPTIVWRVVPGSALEEVG